MQAQCRGRGRVGEAAGGQHEVERGEARRRLVDGGEVDRGVLADRGARAVAGLDAADALRRQRAGDCRGNPELQAEPDAGLRAPFPPSRIRACAGTGTDANGAGRAKVAELVPDDRFRRRFRCNRAGGCPP